MGVPGLWDVLRPASKTRSLTELAVKDGFEKNLDGVRGFRIGIDASIWFFHMEYGREGENPHLRTLFFRCATLMHSPFLPLFVFDGPKRPDFKRGKKISKAPNKLIPAMKQIVEAFGFEHRTAPGEAESELAYLNMIGVIDGVLSDDVDNFLFGATTVIRNPSNSLSGNRSNPVLNAAGKDDKNHSWVYQLDDIVTHPEIGLTRGGLILIGLLSGGDYHSGLERCGMKTAVALAKCGFGDSLYEAATTLQKEQLPPFLDSWRHEMRHEISTNSRGLIGRKLPSLAKSLTSAFPDIDVLLSYVDPITSESLGKPYVPGDIKWDREPDISRLAGICEFYFEWGYKEAIIKRFRTVIWHSAVQRILRRAVLDIDQGKRPAPVQAGGCSTPTKSGRRPQELCRTPSKMIAQHFSTMSIGDQRGVEEERLLIKIHSARTHVSTDELPEYRVEIAPGQLVCLAGHGIQGIREKPVQEWEDDELDDDQASNDPQEHMRVWMPACMVKLAEPTLVQDFEDEVERKLAKKANKGQGRAREKKVVDDSELTTSSPPKPKPPRPRKAPMKDGQDDTVSAPTKGTSAKATASKTATKSKAKDAPASLGLSSDESDGELPSPSRLFATTRLGTRAPSAALYGDTPRMADILSSVENYIPSPSPRRRVGVKDLTKKTTSFKTVSAEMTAPSYLNVNNFCAPQCGSARSTMPVVQKAKAVTTSTTKQKAALPEPRHAVPDPCPLLFFDDDDDDDGDNNPLGYDNLFSSPVRMPKASSSTSDSDSRDRYRKSPRKSGLHVSPASSSKSMPRPDSPTPQSRVVAAKKASKPLSKIVATQIRRPVDSLPVYEISSDSEGEVAPMKSGSAPLLRARALTKGTQSQSRNAPIDFIDLT